MSYTRQLEVGFFLIFIVLSLLTGLTLIDSVDAQSSDDDPYVITVNTSLTDGSTGNESFKIAGGITGTFDYHVSWSQIDGSASGSQSGVTGDTTLNFGTEGKFRVEISGSFPSQTYNVADAAKIVSIDQWGDIQWQSFRRAFYEATNVKYNASDTPDLTDVTTMGSMFMIATSFNGSLNDWNVSSVSNMRWMFAGADSFNRPLNRWNVSSVTTMESMFRDANSFNRDISSWDTSSVTNMDYMFYGASSFNRDISHWDVSSISNTNEFARNSPLNTDHVPSWGESPQQFNLSVQNVNDTVAPGSMIEVDVNISNTGIVEDTQTVRLLHDGSVIDHDHLTIQSGETKTETFQFDLSGEVNGEIMLQLSSDTDSISVTSSVMSVYYTVDITNINETVNYEIENIGDMQGTQDIDLEVDGSIIQTESDVTLNSSETYTGSFDYTLPGTDNVSIVISSDDDSAMRTITEPIPGMTDDNGFLATSIDVPVVGSIPVIPIAGILIGLVGGYLYVNREEMDYF